MNLSMDLSRVTEGAAPTVLTRASDRVVVSLYALWALTPPPLTLPLSRPQSPWLRLPSYPQSRRHFCPRTEPRRPAAHARRIRQERSVRYHLVVLLERPSQHYCSSPHEGRPSSVRRLNRLHQSQRTNIDKSKSIKGIPFSRFRASRRRFQSNRFEKTQLVSRIEFHLLEQRLVGINLSYCIYRATLVGSDKTIRRTV